MGFDFEISKLDIRESFFLGKVLLDNNDYTVNIQTIRREKVLKLPFGMALKIKRL